MPNPAEEVNRVVRTVIEATDPALRPVHKLRRFVVRRVELVAGGPAASTAEPAAKARTSPGTTSIGK